MTTVMCFLMPHHSSQNVYIVGRLKSNFEFLQVFICFVNLFENDNIYFEIQISTIAQQLHNTVQWLCLYRENVSYLEFKLSLLYRTIIFRDQWNMISAFEADKASAVVAAT